MVPKKELSSWSISLRNDSIPVKGLQGSWDGLHGIIGFQRANAIVFPSLQSPREECQTLDGGALRRCPATGTAAHCASRFIFYECLSLK
jgi:hypothetical protein